MDQDWIGESALSEHREREIDPFAVALDQVIAPRDAVALVVHRGQMLRLIDLEGQQVGDFLCFQREDLDDKLSVENTQLINGTIFLTAGHHLYSTKCSDLVSIETDTCGVHDLISGSCSEWTNAFRYGIRGTPNCRSNFQRVLAPYGIGIGQIPYSFNIFMNTTVSPEGRTRIEEPRSKAGDHIDLRVNVDLLVAISNCPQERNPCNGWNPTRLRLVVYETDPRPAVESTE